MNNGSSAFMRSGSQVSGWPSTTASYQRSRGICMSTAPPVWRTTSTVSTELVPGSFSASSTFAFSGTLLAAAQAFVGGDHQLGAAVCTRSAIDCGAKPPNTTECTAPMRAQASIATAASGIIGR
jgi:hypothetical protein